MAKPTDQKLTCAQCGYDNEPERVYCHNCGTKLDRSVLPREVVTQQESLAATRKRIKKLTRPGSGGAHFRTLVNTAIYAVIIAALYLFLMPPSGIPTKEDATAANIISGDIEGAAESPRPLTFRAKSIDLSEQLRSRVKNITFMPMLTDPKRTFVMLDEGIIAIGIEENLWGILPIYTRLLIRPVADEKGGIKYEKAGLYINRLGIDPRFEYFDSQFAPIWKKMKTEAKLAERAQTMTITKGTLVMTTKPATAATP